MEDPFFGCVLVSSSFLGLVLVLYSAVFEKVFTSGKGGLHFQPLPAKVHPAAPREVHGCSRFWKRAGAEFPALGVWPLGPRPAGGGVWGHSVGVPVRRTGNRRKPGSARGPRGPQGPLGIPPGHPRRWLGLATFLALFFWPTGGAPAPKGQNSDFRRSGRNRGSMGLERCGPGPPNGPF